MRFTSEGEKETILQDMMSLEPSSKEYSRKASVPIYPFRDCPFGHQGTLCCHYALCSLRHSWKAAGLVNTNDAQVVFARRPDRLRLLYQSGPTSVFITYVNLRECWNMLATVPFDVYHRLDWHMQCHRYASFFELFNETWHNGWHCARSIIALLI